MSPAVFSIRTGVPAVPVAVKVTGTRPLTVAVTVFVPGAVPTRHDVTVAMPWAFVVCEAPASCPLPDVTANVTATLGAGFPPASRTTTLGALVTSVPTGAVCCVAEMAVTEAAAPAVAVAVKTIGLLETPACGTCADRRCVPVPGPSCQVPADAMPCVFVTADGCATLPPPLMTLKNTVTPSTALPPASRATTDGPVGRVLPAVPLWLLPAFTASEATRGGPAVAVT